MFSYRSTLLSGVAVILLVFAVIGCGGDDDNGDDSTTGPSQGVPNVVGTWAFTLTTVSDTTPEPQAPGTETPLFILITQSGTDLTLSDFGGTNMGSGTIDSEGNFTLSGNFTLANIPIDFTMTGTADPTGTSASGTGTFVPMIGGVPAGAREVTFTGTKLAS